MAALPLLALPKLHYEHVPPPSCDRTHAVKFVRDETNGVALAELVRAQVAVGFERAELAPLVVLAVREHHIDGHERSGIVVRRVRQAAAGLNGVVFDAARRDGARRTRAHVPVLCVHLARRIDQLPVQRGSLASEAAVRRQVRRLPCTLVVRGREIVRTAAGRPETRLCSVVQAVDLFNLRVGQEPWDAHNVGLLGFGGHHEVAFRFVRARVELDKFIVLVDDDGRRRRDGRRRGEREAAKHEKH